MYYAGQSRYIGVFKSKKQAALAYEMAREQLKADSCKDKVERCVQDIHDTTAASTVASMAKRRADILAQETATIVNHKKQKPPNSASGPSSSSTTKASKISTKPFSRKIGGYQASLQRKSPQTTTRSPSFKAVFLQSLQEFASVTECSSLPTSNSCSPRMSSLSCKVGGRPPSSNCGSLLINQSSISSSCSNATMPSFACTDLSSNRSSLSSNGGSNSLSSSQTRINNQMNTIVFEEDLSCNNEVSPFHCSGTTAKSSDISQINRVVSDDSASGGKDMQPNSNAVDHGFDKQNINVNSQMNISCTNNNNNNVEQHRPLDFKFSAEVTSSDMVLHHAEPNDTTPSFVHTTSTAATLPRGITLRPSGKWQAQLYFAGQSRYIGVFESRERAVLAYEIVREKVKDEPENKVCSCPLVAKEIFDLARQAAFAGVQSITNNV